MIQPDIDPAREPLMAQGVLRVAEAPRGMLGDVHRVLCGGAAQEAFAGLLCCPGTLCGSAWRSASRVRDTILAAGSCGRCRAARCAAARSAACIRARAGIGTGPSLARRIRATGPCGATGARGA